MFTIIIGFFVNLLEKLGLGWWKKYEQNEAKDAENRVSSLSDAAITDELRRDWTIKP